MKTTTKVTRQFTANERKTIEVYQAAKMATKSARTLLALIARERASYGEPAQEAATGLWLRADKIERAAEHLLPWEYRKELHRRGRRRKGAR
jgi:hypothetical protein